MTSNTKDIAILLLAAGQSSRMRGRDKLLEPVGQEPCLRVMAQRARATGCPVFVTLPPAPHPRHDAIDDLDVIRIPVPNAAQGMSVSLATGIAGLPQKTKAALVMLADMPDLQTGHLWTLLSAREEHPNALIWRGADQDGRAGHPVIFDASLFPHFNGLEGDTGAQGIVRSMQDHVHLVTSIGAASRTDLDTPEAWDAWHRKNAR